MELLTEKHIQYNTYTSRMQNILLKGTEIDNAKTIERALEKNGIQPHNIQRFETGYMRKINITSNIQQITPKPKTDTNAVTNIRYIAEWSVKWELMKKPLIMQTMPTL